VSFFFLEAALESSKPQVGYLFIRFKARWALIGPIMVNFQVCSGPDREKISCDQHSKIAETTCSSSCSTWTRNISYYRSERKTLNSDKRVTNVTFVELFLNFSSMSVLFETSLGDIVIDLEVDDCPKTCENFLKLCKVYYYNLNAFFNGSFVLPFRWSFMAT